MTRAEMMETYPPEKRPFRIAAELQAAKTLRAVESERQLQEVMVDFWFNHFNVFAEKGDVRWYVSAYERDVIRPKALGRFPDLVRASARHPAMLFYLDNWLSARPEFTVPVGPNKGRKAGLNENYARELMELHTLGVDGGYTQTDVTEVARAFTGWSIDRPRVEGRFVFRPRMHDTGEKVVLGHRIPVGGGQDDGERVLEILTHHPSTARFIATKLVRRFVADTPPPALVARVAATYLKANVGLEVAFADTQGWDTHVGQGAEQGQLAARLREFGGALAAFAQDLGDRMADVVVLTMSEFGRTVGENGNRGTDHGHATAMLVLGGGVRGGRVHGRWPGLARERLCEARDLAVTTDFRTLFSEVAARHLGVPPASLFPGWKASEPPLGLFA